MLCGFVKRIKIAKLLFGQIKVLFHVLSVSLSERIPLRMPEINPDYIFANVVKV